MQPRGARDEVGAALRLGQPHTFYRSGCRPWLSAWDSARTRHRALSWRTCVRTRPRLGLISASAAQALRNAAAGSPPRMITGWSEPAVWRHRVDRRKIVELHFIASASNLGSIGRFGILSHSMVGALPHTSVANQSVQSTRAGKSVPGQRQLHDYANLYFDARNSMMYVLRHGDQRRQDLVVVRVSPTVLDFAGVIVTDGNAASVTTRFYDAVTQIGVLDPEPIFALSWNDPDPFIKAEKKRQRSAEVLVPDQVHPSLLIGCYVERPEYTPWCNQELPGLPVEVNPRVYFC